MAEEYISKYTQSDGLTTAYQIWCEAEGTLMYVPGTISHLEAALEGNWELFKVENRE